MKPLIATVAAVLQASIFGGFGGLGEAGVAEVTERYHLAARAFLLRVTMIFRFERGEWRIVHRHADDMIALELPVPSA
jgi:hypothetical protein